MLMKSKVKALLRHILSTNARFVSSHIRTSRSNRQLSRSLLFEILAFSRAFSSIVDSSLYYCQLANATHVKCETKSETEIEP